MNLDKNLALVAGGGMVLLLLVTIVYASTRTSKTKDNFCTCCGIQNKLIPNKTKKKELYSKGLLTENSKLRRICSSKSVMPYDQFAAENKKDYPDFAEFYISP